MPKSLLLLLFGVLYGCVTVQSTQKNLNSGNYEQTIANALKELRPNKTKAKSQAYVFLLQEAFIKAQERDESSLNIPSNSLRINEIQARIEILEQLIRRQEKIRPILPLYDLKKQTEVNFPFKDYQSQRQQTLNNFSKTLETEVANGIQNQLSPYRFRDYYNKFAFLAQRQALTPLQQNYYQQSREKGTTRAYGVLVNNSRNVLPKRIAERLLNFTQNKALNFWGQYDAFPKANTSYDLEIVISIALMEVSPEATEQQLHQFIEEIEVGTQPLRDESGKIVLDSLGEVTEVPKYENQKQTFYRNVQQKSAHLKTEIEVINKHTKQQITSFPLQAHWEFLNEYGTFTGDQNQLEEDLIALLSAKKISFPSDLNMLYNVCADLSKQLYERLRNLGL